MSQSRIALLRGVNIGGRKLLMADLRAAVEVAGFRGGRTLLQSGNLVVETDGDRTDGEVEAALEAAIQAQFGMAVDFHVRSAVEWSRIIAANPYPDAARDDPAHLLLMTFKADPPQAVWDKIRKMADVAGGREVYTPGDRCGYFVFPDGIGTSELGMGLIDRRLGVRGTGRNWNTVLKLAAMAGA